MSLRDGSWQPPTFSTTAVWKEALPPWCPLKVRTEEEAEEKVNTNSPQTRFSQLNFFPNRSLSDTFVIKKIQVKCSSKDVSIQGESSSYSLKPDSAAGGDHGLPGSSGVPAPKPAVLWALLSRKLKV